MTETTAPNVVILSEAKDLYSSQMRQSITESVNRRISPSPIRRRRRIQSRELALVPIGICNPWRASLVQFSDLRFRQGKACRSEIVAQLLLIARSDNHARNGRFP